MTPGQISAVEESLATVDLDQLTADFYRRAFAEDPSLSEMFTSDPAVQRARFAAELDEIVHSMRSMDAFEPAFVHSASATAGTACALAHYRLMGQALLAALAAALGERWTADVEEAWSLAYNLTAETMLLGAMECDDRDADRQSGCSASAFANSRRPAIPSFE